MGKGCIVIGAAMLDIVMEIDRIPKSGTDVYAKGQSMMVGGCAYNVADILKHFGVNYTDRKSTRLNSSHPSRSRMPSSA